MKSRDIICMALPTWEGDYMKTIVQICEQLAGRHRVLYVEYPFTKKDYWMSRLGRGKAPVERLSSRKKALRKVVTSSGNSLHVLTLPPVWPSRWLDDPNWFDRLQRREAEKAGAAVRDAAGQLGFRDPLVINAFNPLFGLPLLGRLGESRSLYYCYDEIGAAEWLSKHGLRYETEFIRQVDAVVTSSPALLERKQRLQPQSYLVRNGVNFGLFNRGFRPEAPQGSRPQIAYLGSVDDRLDWGLLKGLARRMPEVDFVFTGRIQKNASPELLKGFPNVKLQGACPPEQLPSVLAQSAAGIIPFRKNRFTENIYPLKINEYLAAGLPVVMTGFAPLEEFAEVATVADDAPSFAQALEVALHADSLQRRLARTEFARANSWEARAQELETLIERLYA